MSDDPCRRVRLPGLAKPTLLAASTLTVMAGSTVAPALPQIRNAFKETPGVETLVLIVLTIPALAIGLLAPVSGWVLDRVGRKWTLILGCVLYALAGTAGLWVGSMTWLIASRIVLGIAVAGIMTSATTLVGDLFQGDARTRFAGQQQAAMATGGMLFVLAGGLLATVGWRWPFLVYAAGGLIVPAALLSVPETRNGQRDDTEEVAHSDEPIPWLGMAVLYPTAMLAMLLFYLLPTKLAFFLESQTGRGSDIAGYLLAASTLCGAFASLSHRNVESKLGNQVTVALGFLLQAVGYGILSVTSTLWTMLPGILLVGTGLGYLTPAMNLWGLRIAPLRVRGRIVGGVTASIYFGQFLAGPYAAIVDNFGYFIDLSGTRFVFLSAGVLQVVIAGIYVTSRVTRGKATPLTPEPA